MTLRWENKLDKRLKFIYIMASIVLVLACSYNFYQQNKINSYNRKLTDIVKKHIQHFAGHSGNIDNETAYAEQYASIVAAQEAYIALGSKNNIPSNEWDSSLSGLFVEIKRVMLNDREKFKEVFGKTDASKLMFNISDNFEDRDSINGVFKLLRD